MRILRTSSWGDRISSNSERTALRRRGKEPHYIEVLKQKAGSLNIKGLLLIKKTTTDISWNLNFFYVWEDARIRVHWTHSFHIVFVLVCPTLCNPMDAACQASLSFTISWTCSNSCPLSWWWTGKPAVLQSMGSQRVRHDWVTELNWASCITAAFMLASGYPGLEIMIGYYCTIKHTGAQPL